MRSTTSLAHTAISLLITLLNASFDALPYPDMLATARHIVQKPGIETLIHSDPNISHPQALLFFHVKPESSSERLPLYDWLHFWLRIVLQGKLREPRIGILENMLDLLV